MVAEASAPRASIVVACARDADRLRRCLEGIERGAAGVSHETIVVLNGAPDDVAAVAHAQPGIRVVPGSVNLGFAGASNLGRAHARGEHIVLLHDDAVPEEGWLEALVRAADARPEAGAIGSRMLTLDGTPLHCGGVIFSDGSTAELDEIGMAPAARRVDYHASASLLVRAAAWDEVGGADDELFPAGYVDADVGMRLRRAGWTVWVEPASVVRHRRGGTSSHGYKRWVHERNRRRFVERWAVELAEQEPPAPDDRAGAIARAARRAAVRVPAARRTAGPAGRRPQAAPPPPTTAPLHPRTAQELDMLRAYVREADAEILALRRRLHEESERLHAELREAHRRAADEIAAREREIERLRAAQNRSATQATARAAAAPSGTGDGAAM